MADTASDEGTGRELSAWQIMGPLIDSVTPMAVRVAATLRLADLIGSGTASVADLAESSGADPDALGRLLRHLVCHGVFDEPEPARYTVNGTAALLYSDHPSGMRFSLDLDEFGGRMDFALTGMLHTVRTGKPAWEKVFGAPFWADLAANPAVAASFDATMGAESEQVHDAAIGYAWPARAHVVDVGGGKGALLAEVLQANPEVRATLFDLPETTARAREFLAERGLDGRCTFAGGSFFDQLPTGGDIYVLRHVVHDWGDEEAGTILRRCAEAAGDHGRVIVIESHGTSGDDPGMFAEMDLRMLLISGGRERTVEDYRALASAAGLRVDDVHATRRGQVVLDCVTADITH
ncbi:methyltransferase [Aldersonia sp. NBC_00410]|uniref:methyltransferase n=1 Tax=Aldersonia sp. NBC_00410 TaxID=2975954 RepID=UPI0022521C2E|nr:methyltransferase [Aldersonia sp. NBC_00410]MCX5044441.1 methyltransferase [Aldersonia sp. NBC_00410]